MALQLMYVMAELFVEVDLIACNTVLTACGMLDRGIEVEGRITMD